MSSNHGYRLDLGITVALYYSVTIWYRKFKNKNYNIQEARRFGRPTDAHEARLRELLEEGQHSIS